MAAALIFVPAGCAAVVALSEALRRQRRWVNRAGVRHKARAPKIRTPARSGARFRARAYVRCGTDDSTCVGGISDVESVVSDADFRTDFDDASSVDSFGSEQGAASSDGNGRRRKRLIASSASSECSSASGGSVISLSSIAEFQEHEPEEPPSEELMEYAMALRPLFVTRSELVKIFAKFPAEVMQGPQSLDMPVGHVVHRELLEAICSSIACVVRPDGPTGERQMCLAEGFEYASEDYALTSNLRTRVIIRLRPLGAADSQEQSPVARTREFALDSLADGSQEQTVPPAVAPERRSVSIRVTEIASRELFIAELLAMDRLLRAGMQQRFSSFGALKRRRRTLRHVADVIKVLKQNRRPERSQCSGPN